MAEPYLSEIRIFAFNFPPRGWAQCDGQILPINQYQSLYSLLGTTYGGDGRTNFGLPELRGRTPLHFDSDFRQGANGGEESVPLNIDQIPQHRHVIKCADVDATGNTPADTLFARATTPLYHGFDPANNVTINPDALSDYGGNQPHNNMQPYLALNFCIALQGVFPSRN